MNKWQDFLKFQLTAARRRLVNYYTLTSDVNLFQLTAARRRLVGVDALQ